MSFRTGLGVTVSLLLLAGASLAYRTLMRSGSLATSSTGPVAAAPAFTDITRCAGIKFSYFRGETGQFWLTETIGGGVGLIDFDGDGYLDIYFVNGCKQPFNPEEFTHTAQLYRNQRDGTYAEVTDLAGVAARSGGCRGGTGRQSLRRRPLARPRPRAGCRQNHRPSPRR